MAAIEAKLIKFKGETKHLTFEDIQREFNYLIYKFIKQWSTVHYDDYFDHDDIVQLCNLGLWKAYKNYNYTYGCEFMTYAYPLMQGELRRHWRDRLRKTDHRGVSHNNFISLNTLIDGKNEDDKNTELIELIPSKENCEEKALNNALIKKIKSLLNELNPSYWQIIIDYYINELKQSEIAQKYNVNQVYISRLLNKRIPKKIKKIFELESINFGSDLMYGNSLGGNKTRGPILNIKREQEDTEKFNKTECTTTKLTPEQLQYYKSLPYEKAKEFLEKILKGEKVKMEDNKQIEEQLDTIEVSVSKMTKENLQADIDAGLTVNQIAKKYKKQWIQVRNILQRYGLWDKRNICYQFKSQSEVKKSDIDEIFAGTSTDENVQAETLQQNSIKTEQINNIPPQKKKLQITFQILKGEYYKFRIDEESIFISPISKSKKSRTSFKVEKSMLKPFISELEEIQRSIIEGI